MHLPAMVLLLSLAWPSAGFAQASAGASSPELLETWLTAIAQHQPGSYDSGVGALLRQRTADLESQFEEMTFVLRTAMRSRVAFDAEVFGPHVRHRFSDADEQKLREIASRYLGGPVDRFLKRAALLHADIAILSPRSHQTWTAGTSQLVTDGADRGDEGRSWHWLLGRAFLHLLPDAQADPDVRLWYQAVGVHLWSIGNYTELRAHLERARDLFPEDAEIHFLTGALHEAWGAAHVQAVVENGRAGSARATAQILVQSAPEEQERARDAYRRVLRADPSHDEARVRLGRVLSLRGGHDEAARLLAESLPQITDRRLRYLALLFLGCAEEGRRRFDEARRAYRDASELFPDAQSPHLALASLALVAGDRRTSQRVLLFLQKPVSADADPWWEYHYERQPTTEEWLERLRSSFAQATQ
jgi:tetratricopeptide (TPR) repeat protein